MIDRRTFVSSLGAGFTGALCSRSLADQTKIDGERRKRLAVVTTVWRNRSHAWHMAERFLAGYPRDGKWHRPPIDVVSAYVDQKPEGDLSRQRAEEFGFPLSSSIAEALRCGEKSLAVDAVLIIGEHGDYPENEIGQKKYPRYEFFKAVTDVFREDGRAVPVFNDKHLSWKWEWAKSMVQTSRELKFPFLAGSSLPVTWRMPDVEMPSCAEVEELMCVAIGRVDSYDFHALEVIQCMAERRKGGETGVVSMQALTGDAFWKAMAAGSWDRGGWDPELLEACLCRSQTLAQAPQVNHRHPTSDQIREWVKTPYAYRFEYADGTKATMLLMNGLVGDFTFAARLKGKREPLSTLFYLPPGPNVTYSAALMSKAEEMFVTGKAPYPIERTLLTTGLVEAGMKSLAKDGEQMATPHLSVRYQPPRKSLHLRR